jgi:hypothetical protein
MGYTTGDPAENRQIASKRIANGKDKEAPYVQAGPAFAGPAS